MVPAITEFIHRISAVLQIALLLQYITHTYQTHAQRDLAFAWLGI